jgi:hypothetical protein
MTKRIIGVSGLKTAGKDTTYSIVADLVPGTKRAAFADKLKIMAMRALGYDGSPAELVALANKIKEDGGQVNSCYLDNAPFSGSLQPFGVNITGREYLQRFGGHARELFGENFWVDQVLPEPPSQMATANNLRNAAIYSRMAAIIDPWTLKPRGNFTTLCVTDVRYPNEAERVLALDGEVWEVVRPGLEPDGHASEVPLPRELVTRVIDNSGTLGDLRNNVAWVLECNRA